MKYILGVNGKILHEFYAVEVNYKYSGARHGHLTTSAAKVVRHVTIEVLRHTGHIAVIQITGSNSAVTLGLRFSTLVPILIAPVWSCGIHFSSAPLSKLLAIVVP